MQAFQKSQVDTLIEGPLSGSQIKTKHEPIVAVVNKGQTNRRPNKEQYKRKTNDTRNNARHRTDQKPCTNCGRAFVEGTLKVDKQWGRHVRTVINPTFLLKCAGQNNKTKSRKTQLVRMKEVV